MKNACRGDEDSGSLHTVACGSSPPLYPVASTDSTSHFSTQQDEKVTNCTYAHSYMQTPYYIECMATILYKHLMLPKVIE